jgi:hypothetical protein
MLAELRKHVPAEVKTVQAAFEDVRSGESYGLVFAAAALDGPGGPVVAHGRAARARWRV